MSRAGRHFLPCPRGQGFGRRRQGRHQSWIAQGGNGPRNRLQTDSAALAAVRLTYQPPQRRFHPLQHRDGDIAELKQDRGCAGNNAWCARRQNDRPGRPGTALRSDTRKFIVDRGQQPDRGQARILSFRHGRAAGVILIAPNHNAPLPDRDNAADHADAKAGLLKLSALLDMHFQEAPYRPGSSRMRGFPSKQLAKRHSQRRAIVPVRASIDFLFRQFPDDRAAAKEPAVEMTFLVGEGTDIDREAGSGERDPGHDPERPIEPAGLVLGFNVATYQQMRAGPFVPAINVADAINGCIQAACRQAINQPAPQFHVLRREGGPMDAGAERADAAQFVQVTEEGVGIDWWHGQISLHGLARLGVDCRDPQPCLPLCG